MINNMVLNQILFAHTWYSTEYPTAKKVNTLNKSKNTLINFDRNAFLLQGVVAILIYYTHDWT